MLGWFRSRKRFKRGGPDGWLPAPGGEVRLVDVLHATGRERVRLADRLAQKVQVTPPSRLDSFAAGSISGWINRSDVPKLGALPRESAIGVLGVASMTGDGYAREEAIRRLRIIGDPAAVPFLLLRLGDWVPEVRAAARDAIGVLSDKGIASELVRNHALVDRLLGIRRVDLSDTHYWLIGMLREDAGLAGVRAGLENPDMRVRRFCLRVLGDIAACRDEVWRSVMADPDPGIRAWLAGRVIAGRINVPQEVFRGLLVDPSAMVSAKMIRSLDEREIRSHAGVLLDLACADSKPVRGSAQFALRRIGEEGVAQRARALVESASEEDVQAGWIAALSECAGEDALPLLRRFTQHERSGVRAAALGGLDRHDPDGAIEPAMVMLGDASNAVRRVSVRVLARVPGDRWCDRGEALLVSERAGVRRTAFDLLATRGGWDMLVPVLHALAMDDRGLRERAWWTLSRWDKLTGRFGWLRPSRELLVRLVQLRECVPNSVAEDRWQQNLLGWLDRALDDCRRESGV